jgi:ribosomal protein S18 acetylase RimI-like enzyme
VIREATRDDAEGILACLREAFEPYRASYTPGAFQDTVLAPKTIGERLAAMTVLVAVTEADVVAGTIACVGSDLQDGHIRGMAVRSKFQGSGLAQQLLTSAESELKRRGCTRITLDTTAPLQRAIRFYEKHGYRASGRVTDFFGMPLFEYVKPLS